MTESEVKVLTDSIGTTITKSNDKTEELLKQTEIKLLNKDEFDEDFKFLSNEDIVNVFHMVTDYSRGEYKLLPVGSVISAVGMLGYWLWRKDVIPDDIPKVGKIDDAFVINVAMCGIRSDVEDYLAYKQNNSLTNALNKLGGI